MGSWDTNPCSNFCEPHWVLICHYKWHPGSSEMSTLPEIAVGIHFHAQHGTKTTWYFYLLMEKPLRCYFQVWSPYYQVALCNQKISVPVFSRWQVRRSQKAKRKISINTNHNYHQRSSPLVSLNRSNNKIRFRFNQPNKRCGVRLADAIKHLTHKNEPI